MARIIIADDDELVVDMVRSVLEARGHIVGSLEDGSRVKQVVETKRPDLVILDCSMPEKSGIQVLRELRTSLIAHETQVLVLTGRRSLNDEGIAWNAGTDDYLRKPFDPDELVVRVEALLDSAA
jgi:DNA-binding response OmpR family regulator